MANNFIVRKSFYLRGNTARIQFRIVWPDDELLDEFPELLGNIWISTFDNLERGNGHGRMLLEALQLDHPGMSLNLFPAPSRKLREYYKSIGFEWDKTGCYMCRKSQVKLIGDPQQLEPIRATAHKKQEFQSNPPSLEPYNNTSIPRIHVESEYIPPAVQEHIDRLKRKS
jgi:hypothetical protein